MNKLEGKVALVTGSGRGIGAAIAERLAADGAVIALNYSKSASEAEAVAERIRKNGGRAKVFKADVSDPKDAKTLVDRTVEELGRLDILVNNAGTTEFAPLEAITEDAVRSQFGVNVNGPIFVLQAAAAHFPREAGRVINVSSLASRHSPAGASLYAATKSALEALTRSWAAELGPKGITVNAVAPGPIDTDMLRQAGLNEQVRQGLITRTPLGRIGSPSDVADVVAFLASHDARWITGQVVETAGGLTP
jgi:3-oxoacyl-[acyl-carrier protein] reductase